MAVNEGLLPSAASPNRTLEEPQVFALQHCLDWSDHLVPLGVNPNSNLDLKTKSVSSKKDISLAKTKVNY